MPDELKPPTGGMEGVSLETARKTAPETQPEVALESAEPKKLRIADLPVEERRAYWRKTKDKSREKADAKEKKTSQRRDYTGDFSRKDAREVLIETGLTHERIIDCVVDLAEVASQQYHIPFNDYLVRHGLRATLAAIDGTPLSARPGEDHAVIGEIISDKHLYALWDFGLFRKDVGYDEYLKIRNQVKKDCFLLGRDLLGRDFHEQPHKGWQQFLPSLNPDTLNPNFSQEEMKSWLAEQGKIRGASDFLLQSSRNAYKSTFVSSWIISAILTCPSFRILILSERKDLARGFIKLLRSTFEIRNPNEPDTFQQFFYEFCIPVGDGSALSYECPMRHLTSLIQPTAEANSMDSSVVGGRCDVLVADDPVSNMTTGTDEACQSGIEKLALAKKLIEVGGLFICVSTPWSENPPDVYADMIRNAAETNLQVKIDPCWIVKPKFYKDIHKMTAEERNKYLFSLTEDQVDLLFKARLSFAFLRKELKSNPRLFISQNLVEFVKEDSDSLTVVFTEDDLRHHLRPAGFFTAWTTIQLVVGVDTAPTANKYSDLSCITSARIVQHNNADAIVVTRNEMGHFRQSELVNEIIKAIYDSRPNNVVIEKANAAESLQLDIARAAMLRGMQLPRIYFRPSSNKPNAKALRIKSLEQLIADDRLWFCTGDWNDAAFDQMINYSGKKSSLLRKDDFPDVLSIIAQTYLQKHLGDPTKTEEQKEQEEFEKNQARLKAHTDYIFGSTAGTPQHTVWQEEPQDVSTNPIFRGNGAVLRRQS